MSIEYFRHLLEIDEEDDMMVLCMIACVEQYITSSLLKSPVHTAGWSGNQKTLDMLAGHWRVCYDACRMRKEVFVKLCGIMKTQTLLRPTREVSVEEQMHMFLYALGHGHVNRVIQDMFQHSGETVSRHFNTVLRGLTIWVCDMINPKESLNNTPQHIREYGGGKYYPYFKDCVGALDGTHIHAWVSKDQQLSYRSGRDPKHTTQNVLAICDFQMRFTFAVSGWEGSAHDSRILNETISDCDYNFPMPPNDKYYLVDAGYQNRKGFLAPYRRTRYHLQEFRTSQPRNREEVFNRMHSSLRNVIERAFGVLKKRWALLNHMGPYPLESQAMLVTVAMALHNFIIDERFDELLEEIEQMPELNGQPSSTEPNSSNTGDDVNMATFRDKICEAIDHDRLV